MEAFMIDTYRQEDLMCLLTAGALTHEPYFHYTEETARRYFRDKIFYIHKLANNNAHQTYRGSAIVRLDTLEKIKLEAKNQSKQLSVSTIGGLFKEVGGPDDEFIVSKILKGEPVAEIANDFKQLVEKAAL